MQVVLLMVSAVLLVSAKPEGYYHSESEFHSSASSYKNNELQRQNQDDEFYSEHGDLGRKTKPKVNSYAQHSEYVNPKLKNQESGGYTQGFGSNFDGSAFGSSQTEHQGRHDYRGSSAYDSHGRYIYGGRSNSGSSSYGVSSNLEDITRRLQSDLARQLQSAISQQYRESSSYAHSSSISSAQMQQDLQELEEELRANLTRKLQDALNRQYGQQRQHGGLSYSVTHDDDLSDTANYDNLELRDLKQEIENNLLQQLRQDVRTKYQSSQSYGSSYQSSNQDYNSGSYNSDSYHRPQYTNSRPQPLNYDSQTKTGYRSGSDRETTTRYQPIYPSLPDSSYSGSNSYSSNARYTITEVAHNVQTSLNQVINDLLDEQDHKNEELVRRGDIPNYEDTFEDLKRTLKRNISELLEDELRANFGQQIERDSQYYSLTPSGTTKPHPNYSAENLESLKQQLEDNLVEKLSYGIRLQINKYSQQKSYSDSYSRGYGSSYPSSYPSHYDTSYDRANPLSSGSQTSNVNLNSDSELYNIKRRIQDDLARQIQFAVREQTKAQSSYSSSSTSGGSNSDYQATLQELTEELKRNLTEKLQQQLNRQYDSSRSGGYSYSGTAGGSLRSSNYNSQQYEELRRQLQDNLVRQLQENLRQSFDRYRSYGSSAANQEANGYGGYSSYGSSSSYSASGSYGASASYGSSGSAGSHGVKGGLRSYRQLGLGQIQTDAELLGEDCMQGDDSFTRSHPRNKRSSEDSSQSDSGSHESGSRSPKRVFINSRKHDSNEDNTFNGQDDLTQQAVDLAPEMQDYDEFLALVQNYDQNRPQKSVPSSEQYTQGQVQTDDFEQLETQDDLTQQTEDLTPPKNYENHKPKYQTWRNNPIYSGSYSGQQQTDFGQQTEDLSPYYTTNYRKPKQYNEEFNQQAVDTSEELRLASQNQQTEDLTGYVRTQYRKQDEEQLNQQTVDDTEKVEKLQFGSQVQEDDLTQQTEDLTPNFQSSYRQPNRPQSNYQQPIQVTENVPLSANQKQEEDLTQQREDIAQHSQSRSDQFERQQFGYQKPREDTPNQQYAENFDQQTAGDSRELHLGTNNQNNKDLTQQKVEEDDLTQKTEDMSVVPLQKNNAPETSNAGNQKRDVGQSASSTSPQPYNQYGSRLIDNRYKNTDQEDLTQQTEDLSPYSHSNNKNRRQPGSRYQTQDDFIQQTADLSSYSPRYNQNRRQQQQDSRYQRPDQEDLTQQTEDLSPYSQRYNQNRGQKPEQEDLAQQREDDDKYGKLEVGNQRTEQNDSTQQTEDLSIYSQRYNQDRRQQSRYQKPGQENLQLQQREDDNKYGKLEVGNQRSDQDDLTQQTEDLSPYFQRSRGQQSRYQKPEDLTQQTEDIAPKGKDDEFGRLQAGTSKQDEPKQQTEDLSLYSQRRNNQYGRLNSGYQKPQDLTQQQEDLTQQTEDLTPNYDNHGRLQSESTYFNRYSSTNKPELQYASQHQVEDGEVSDLVQKPIKPQRAYEVYDNSPQAVDRQLPEQHENYEGPSGRKLPDEEYEIIEQNTTPKPGFWKRLGNKITNAYTSVKEKITG